MQNKKIPPTITEKSIRLYRLLKKIQTFTKMEKKTYNREKGEFI